MQRLSLILDFCFFYNLRYRCYRKLVFKKTADITSLSSTKGATRLYSLSRIYYQVQKWLGHEKAAEEWGCKKIKNSIMSITTLQPPAPEAVLRQIFCKCNKTAMETVAANAGLYCSLLCLNCDCRCKNIGDDKKEEGDDDLIVHDILYSSGTCTRAFKL